MIPKGRYVTSTRAEASDAEIADFTRTIARLCAELGVAPDAGGTS